MAGRAGRLIYSSPRWRAIRRRVLDAAGWRCRCGRLALEVHHLVPIAEGGAPFDETNLEARCVECHRDEHDPRAPTARAWRRLVVEVAQ